MVGNPCSCKCQYVRIADSMWLPQKNRSTTDTTDTTDGAHRCSGWLSDDS